MPDIADILQAGGNGWLYLPIAVLLGALHGLEPGHSKTMMAAYIVAIRGTVGQAVLHWYLTGKHATRKVLGGFMREALTRGRTIGRNFRSRMPGRKREALPAGEILLPMEPSPDARICPRCSTVNDADARFCKNCGAEL